MLHDSSPADVEAYLAKHHSRELLRFVTVGSVDDGKSTLIGRLLHDTQGVYDDQLEAVKKASAQGNLEIDFSLFTDGLEAEREQGITIDVAYRYFSTERRKFIIADTPGHVQYTRNMATGASTASVAIILIDARLGVQKQSRRHAYIASLLGIPHLAVLINKMDLREFDQRVFAAIVSDFRLFSSGLGFRDVSFIPISALRGDNVVFASSQMGWFGGPTVLDYLEAVPVTSDRNLRDFRFPVQYVIRPDLHYRGFAGQIASGVVRRGDRVTVLPSGNSSRIAAIDTFAGELEEAYAPMSVSLRLEDDVDVSRGNWIVACSNLPFVARSFDADLVWLSERPLDTSRSYWLKNTTQLVRVNVDQVLSVVDLETLEQRPLPTLNLNDIGSIRVSCHRPLCFDAYANNRSTGAFILIDALSNDTVAAGMIRGPLQGQGPSARGPVTPRERAERYGQKGAVLLLSAGSAPGPADDLVDWPSALERHLFDAHAHVLKLEPAKFPSQHSFGLSAPMLEFARAGAEAGLLVLLPVAALSASERQQAQDALAHTHTLEILPADAPAEAAFETADWRQLRLHITGETLARCLDQVHVLLTQERVVSGSDTLS